MYITCRYINPRRSWILFKNNEIGLVNFAFYSNNKIFISVRVLKEIRVTTPCSSSLLFIFSSVVRVENNKYFPTFKECVNIPLTDIKCKYYALSDNQQLIFIPLLHTLDSQ